MSTELDNVCGNNWSKSRLQEKCPKKSPKQTMAHSWNTDCIRWLVNSQSLGAVDETRDTPLSYKSRLTRMDRWMASLALRLGVM